MQNGSKHDRVTSQQLLQPQSRHVLPNKKLKESKTE
jgi:hypothetical protein